MQTNGKTPQYYIQIVQYKIRDKNKLITHQSSTWPTIQVLGIWVISVNGNDLPVGFSLINHGQDAQDFHLDDLAGHTHLKKHVNRSNTMSHPVVGAVGQFHSVSKRSRCAARTREPTSHTSMGSLSPQHSVSLSVWLGSSHVCQNPHAFSTVGKHAKRGPYGWQSYSSWMRESNLWRYIKRVLGRVWLTEAESELFYEEEFRFTIWFAYLESFPRINLRIWHMLITFTHQLSRDELCSLLLTALVLKHFLFVTSSGTFFSWIFIVSFKRPKTE